MKPDSLADGRVAHEGTEATEEHEEPFFFFKSCLTRREELVGIMFTC